MGERLKEDDLTETLLSLATDRTPASTRGRICRRASGTRKVGARRTRSVKAARSRSRPSNSLTPYAALINGGHFASADEQIPGRSCIRACVQYKGGDEARKRQTVLLEGMRGAIQFGTAEKRS